MKNSKLRRGLYYNSLAKILLIMRISLLLLILGILQSYGSSIYSQKSSISLNLKETKLNTALDKIEKESDYFFLYNEKLFDINRIVSVNVKNEPISAILDKLFSGTDVRYTIVDNKIILAPSFVSKASLDNYQQQTVKGHISDASTGEPIVGANIVIEGTTLGVVSDIDGNFSIEINKADAVLAISFLGYNTEHMAVSGQSNLDIKLIPDITKLEEVIVVGYGTQKAKDLTSSITVVKSGDLAKTPSGQAMQAVQGKVAGLQVVTNGGPGNSPTVRIRGIGSYPGSGSENPLFVVDGMFFDNIDFLNPSDISSITVLKDASAAAIYGVRAANGVVLIETKSGEINQKAEITYDGYYGTQIAQNVLKMANAEQFTTMAQESGSAADAEFILNAMQRFGRSRVNPSVPDVNTDWYKEILRPATIQNHSLGITGGNQKASYSLGTSYFDQQGILDMKNDYERFNLRSKIDYKAKDWLTVGGNVLLSNALQYKEQANAWNLAYFAVPILPVYDELNTSAWPVKYANAQDIGYRSGQNPFPTLKYNEDQLKIMKLLGNFYIDLNIIPKKLSFKTSYNYSYTDLNERVVNLPYYIGNSFQVHDSKVNKSTSTYLNQIWDNVLTYTNSFGNHNVVAMVGSSYRDEAFNKLAASALNFPTEHNQSWYINQSGTIVTEDVTDDGSRYYGLSYFGRLSYNFKDKYLVYGTMRADGSSKYQEKWGYFPTIGAGWVISEEAFMKNIPVIDYLKLRASWGQLGNDKIPASAGANTNSVVTTAINGTLVSGTTASSTFSWLKWEVTEETNVGLTAKLFNSRLSIDADYFTRDTKNAAINVTIPVIGGTVMKNVGVIRNSGLELVLNWNQKLTNDLQFNVGGNISTLKNEVKDLYGQPYIDGGSAEFRQRSIVGEPILAFYGREVVGVYQNNSEIQADPIAVANGLVPGDFKYKDQNNDKILDDKDRVVLGSYFPTLMYGFNFGITYKSIELSANMLGQSGNKILNRKRGEIIWTADQNMDADLAINRWHGEGTSNKYPSSAGLRKGWNQKMSDYFVEDGSFFRIQNVQLAYNIKGKQLFGLQMPDARITLTADHPLTLFKYNGFNPEVANGIDTQTYPIPAVYTLGLSLKF